MAESPTTAEQMREIAAAWWLLVLSGSLSVVTGFVVLAKPAHSLATLAVIFGIFVLLDSIYELARSIFVGYDGVGAVLGVFGTVIGILLIRHPVHGVLAIGLLIGIWFVATGALRLVQTAAHGHRGWSVAWALLEIVAGIVILADPHASFTTLAVLAGIPLVLIGVAIIGLGWSLRALKRSAPGLVPETGGGT